MPCCPAEGTKWLCRICFVITTSPLALPSHNAIEHCLFSTAYDCICPRLMHCTAPQRTENDSSRLSRAICMYSRLFECVGARVAMEAMQFIRCMAVPILGEGEREQKPFPRLTKTRVSHERGTQCAGMKRINLLKFISFHLTKRTYNFLMENDARNWATTIKYTAIHENLWDWPHLIDSK